MFYWLLSEVLGFSYGVEEAQEYVPDGAITFPNAEALQLAVERAQKEVDAEFDAFQKEADEGLPVEEDKEEDKEETEETEAPVERTQIENEILSDFNKGLDHDTIKAKYKVSDIRSLARKLGIKSPGQLKENELCQAIDEKLKENE